MRYFVIIIAIIISVQCIVAQENNSVSIDPDRELIVTFRSGNVTPSSDSAAGQVTQFAFVSSELQQALNNAGIE
jgi:hypothetical protein